MKDAKSIAICEALKRLRASRPEYANYSRFAKASGIFRPTVESAEAAISLPGVRIIEKWVTACGVTLSRFFAQLETEAEETDAVRIVLGQERFYSLLTEIFENDKPEYVQGIQANLKALAIASRSDDSAQEDRPALAQKLSKKELEKPPPKKSDKAGRRGVSSRS